MKHFSRTITWSAWLILISCVFLAACSEENEWEPTPVKPESPTPVLDTYQLPIVFHVLYQDETDRLQYIPAAQLASVLKRVNDFYAGKTLFQGGSAQTNMSVQFYLAKKDENGKTLQTPGVDYVRVQNVEIDCEKFMSDEGLPYQRHLWNPNRYINVFLYHFAEIQDGEILGISHLPYNVKNENELVGLNEVKQSYIQKENLRYIHCVSLNSKYAYEQTAEYYSAEDFAVTMAHELGHYLGLHHAFDEDDQGNLASTCIDSDYCKDTPSYNRNAYLSDLEWKLSQDKEQKLTLSDLVKRQNCKTGLEFSSYNIMDYMYSYADRFTNDQRTRILHVLQYSPLLPTPRNNTGTIRIRAVEGVLDLPYKVVK